MITLSWAGWCANKPTLSCGCHPARCGWGFAATPTHRRRSRGPGVVSDRVGRTRLPVSGAQRCGSGGEWHHAKEKFVLVTSRLDLPAELIGPDLSLPLADRAVFKWLKSILGSAHWLAESPRGAAISFMPPWVLPLLLSRWLTLQRPTKRQREALALYFADFATEAELLRELNLQNWSHRMGGGFSENRLRDKSRTQPSRTSAHPD